ncbi:MAG TPA: DUF4394 domain-containing protein [Pyrinomonadaceae bacterium]|nr:DUF4394 domain-containing protein [Pyrinomonadaceae bacterium]
MKRKLIPLCILLFVCAAEVSAATLYGVNVANQLIRFRSTAPGTLELQVAITGLQPGESIMGIDFRPANRQLYALGNSGRLYTLDTVTGAATLVAQLAADPADSSAPFAGLSGTEFGFDFDPVADRIRVVSEAEQNLRVNPDNGLVTTDAPLAFAAGDSNAGDNPAVTAAAYSNNFPGATTTTLYDIDTFNDALVIQNPNAGTLTTLSSLFIGDIAAVSGFDIAPGNSFGLLAYTNAANPSASLLASVSLGSCCGATATATPNVIGGGSRMRDIAVQAASFFRLNAANYVVDETAGTVTFSIFRFGDTSTSASVTVTTSDGTAIAPFDYSQTTQSVFFDPGETVNLFSISIVNNPVAEDAETFTVSLTNPSGPEPVTLDTPRTATVTITEGSPTPTPSPTAVTVFGVSLSNRLFSFRSTNPGTIDYSVPITGLQPGESVLNIDVRPATGQLYALGSAGRLYTLDTVTGAATFVAPLAPDPSDGSDPFAGLSGTEFGFDFNPVADRIRVVSDSDQNLRINPDNGLVITDGTIAYAADDPNVGRDPSAVAAAYTNPDTDPATGTTLYVLEAGQDMLVTQNPPNNGTLNTVGPLNVNLTQRVGFDIAPDNSAYGTHTPQGGSNSFFRVNLNTGSIISCCSSIGFPDVVRDIAVAPGNLGVLQLDASSYTVDEDDGSLIVTVNRTGGSSGTVMVNYSTAPAFGATPGQDYTPVTGTLTFGPGETTQTFAVPILEDALVESTEQFNVILSGPVGGAALGTPSTAGVTIVDNDSTIPPGAATLSVDDVTVVEGNTGTLAVFTVTLSAPRNFTITAQYITSSGTANAGVDYEPVSGTVTFGPGVTSRTISVPVNGDVAPEANETFFVNLSNPTGAAIADAQGQATITDDDVPPTASFAFGAASYAGTEAVTEVLVTVNRTGDTSGAMTVAYSTANGSASDRSDYTFAAGTLEFAPGETSKTIPILISEDSYVEGTETLTVTLSQPTGGGGLGSQASTTVIIIDDASEPSTNAIDDTETFVGQHYHDFLNRQADAEGLAFWEGGIDSCGEDLQCREVKRIETSAAFFLAIEFQQTGFIVERAYRAAFNRRVLLGEFLPDTQEIGRGVVVGQTGYEAVLEANKRDYFDAFAARPQFAALYGSLTNAQYVDALNANSGGALSTSERDALVAALDGGTVTRAQALRSVVEDATFAASEFNRAFVLTQYFGYLRRDPDEPGFQFWLDKMNEFGGDFRRAEMVKAFISSIEYRQRFGQ